ncbi:MAG: NADH-quinone oxidoreductase subunit D [Deltaproteobacteria bacterium]|nr:NADH-quinone oxidoreductase subunit D [Deltaproteobacteria bacterium]MCL5791574.1 NADH-quinone oxidoreductase subunit D [Deltaproteobacteria bacterium]
MTQVDERFMYVNMGPQHPSTHGVLRLLLKTDGEIVEHATPHIGYLHRGLEKIAERVTFPQFTPFTDRLDYLASMNCNLAYALTVEKLLNIEIPRRAQIIRVIMAELNRISSHLIAFGSFSSDMGAFTPFLYGIREREFINDLFEMVCGNRLTYNYIRIGGVSKDIPDGFIEKTKEFLDYFPAKLKEYNEVLSYNAVFVKRLANVGVITTDQAIEYGITGPNLRASGIKWDLRREEPYLIYNELDFDVPVGKGEMGTIGDSWDRYMMRIYEMGQSARIVGQCLDMLPQGDFTAKVPKVLRVPQGEVYVRAENPRGELGFYLISDGSIKPYRLKIRAPSFANLSIFPLLAKGVMVADIVALIGSLDIILPEIDR